MPRSILLVGTVLAAIWIAAAGVLMTGDGPAPLPLVAKTEVKQVGELHLAMMDLDPAAAPVKAIALEQIARVTQLGVPPPRNVSPAGTTGWPTPGIDATRVSGALPEAPPPEPPEPDMFHRVVVENAGTLKSGKSKIILAHIETRSRGHKCHDTEGRKWPCGQAAVTELRMLIRGRALACEGVKGPRSLTRKQPRTCHIGPTDVAEWLITQGWVTPTTDAPERYRDAHLAAQQEKRGIYGAAWGRGVPSATLPEATEAGVPEVASSSDT
ncbi:MAG: hypothetical protein AAGD23_05000 [Pseudomonadota bacterium]